MTRHARPLALVTGASSGIGLELARELAGRGYDLLINAEDHRLDEARRELAATGAEVTEIKADLRDPDGVERLWKAAVHFSVDAGRPLDVVALNAGVGQGGRFVETDLADEVEIIDLNCRSTVQLAKRVLRDMVPRGSGGVLITSSIASTMPGTYQAVYNASKSFLQSFAQALRAELEDTGVTVTALMPGPTDTDFFRRAGMLGTRVGSSDKDDPAKVARHGVAAVLAGERKVVGGSLMTKVAGLLNDVLPDRVKAAAHAFMAEPGSAAPPRPAAGREVSG